MSLSIDNHLQIGKGKKDVVLVHGFGNNALNWLPFVLPLYSNAKFHIVDLPGHGRSFNQTPSEENTALVDLASSIEKTVQTLNGRAYILIGYSLGAYSTLQFLSHTKNLPTKYMHIDHSPWPGVGWDGEINNSLLPLFQDIVNEVENYPNSVKNVTYKNLPSAIKYRYHKTVNHLHQLSITNVALSNTLGTLKNFRIYQNSILESVAWPWGYRIICDYLNATFDFREAVKSFDFPVALVAPQEDSLFCARSMYGMKRDIPNATFIELGLKHDIPIANPILFFKTIKKFIGDS